MTPAARYFEASGVLVLTGHAFGAGHLFCREGEGPVWHGTWACKGGREAIEAKWQSMGGGEEPIPCLFYIDRFGWATSSPFRDPVFDWIGQKLETQHGIHIPAEVVRVSWLDPAFEDARYPWRLRTIHTAP